MNCLVTAPCNDEKRRGELVLAAPFLNGIEAVEIVPKPDSDPLVERVLAIFFFSGIPAGLNNTNLDKFQISGGVRVPGNSIRMVDVQTVAGHLELTVDRYGDFSDYVLSIDHSDLDPLYRCRKFSFKVDCPNPFDCTQPGRPPAVPAEAPPIDYQTKDYRSFRRALLDFLPSRVPGFDQPNEADLAVTLAELFAYAGDQLSYFQDAVANEAYLETARQRRSVKRYARLVDYRMHEGAAARTVIHFQVNSPVVVASGFQISTNEQDPSRRHVFETEEPMNGAQEQNVMSLHTWLNAKCCLPVGSTFADLDGAFHTLNAGQLLLLEEELGPVTLPDGSVVLAPGGADLSRRQIVRLTKVEFLIDQLPRAWAAGHAYSVSDLVTFNLQVFRCISAHTSAAMSPPPAVPALWRLIGHSDVTRVTWRDEDALRYEFCLQADALGNVATVARGNLARASHGETAPIEPLDLATKLLSKGPLTWLDPVNEGAPVWLIPPDVVEPKRARSTIQLSVNGEPWHEQESLLDSGPNDPDFVVDTDSEGRGLLRFGDGELGRKLPASATVLSTYRVGNGAVGNVGADVLTVMVAPDSAVDSVRNPLPALGGSDPEPIAAVRRDAPQAFLAVQYRAVTAADYAASTSGVKGVSQGAATFRWTGSWLTVFDAIDAQGRAGLAVALKGAVIARLDSWRQAGYDLEIVPPIYVPLEIALHLCVLPDYFRADVMRLVTDALSSTLRADGSRGFFHPDNFTFGQPLYLSRLYAAVQNISGIRAIDAVTFRKLNRTSFGELQAGMITVAPFEIVRLDNDRSFPDNGRLILTAEGGK